MFIFCVFWGSPGWGAFILLWMCSGVWGVLLGSLHLGYTVCCGVLGDLQMGCFHCVVGSPAKVLSMCWFNDCVWGH